MPKNSSNSETKAGAFLCPSCCVAYIEVVFDCEIEGTIIRDVKALKCPCCGEEVFTPEQQQVITKKLDH